MTNKIKIVASTIILGLTLSLSVSAPAFGTVSTSLQFTEIDDTVGGREVDINEDYATDDGGTKGSNGNTGVPSGNLPGGSPGGSYQDPDAESMDNDARKLRGTYKLRNSAGKIGKTPIYVSGDKEVQSHPLFKGKLQSCREATPQNKTLVGFTVRLYKDVPMEWGQTTCYWVQPVKEVYRCVVDMSLTVDSHTVPNWTQLKIQGKETTWGKKAENKRTRQDCINSKDSEINKKLLIKKYGRYTFKIKANEDIVTYIKEVDPGAVGGRVTYSKDPYSQESRVVSIKTSYMQYVCGNNGYTSHGSDKSKVYRDMPGGGSWTYTETDCGPGTFSKRPSYQCVASGSNTIDGKNTSSATLFRNGENTSIKFQNLTVKESKNSEGSNLVKINSTKTEILRSGTPWNVNGKSSANDNNFVLKYENKNRLKSSEGTGFIDNNLKGTWQASANWASQEGKPTSLQKVIEVNAIWKKLIYEVKSVDINAKVVFSTKEVRETGTAQCSGKPITLNYVRGITTN